jgi:hypothetical protein
VFDDCAGALDLEADPAVPLQDIDLSTRVRRVDVQRIVAIAEIQRNDIRFSMIDHRDAAHPGGRKDIVYDPGVGDLFFFPAHVTRVPFVNV